MVFLILLTVILSIFDLPLHQDSGSSVELLAGTRVILELCSLIFAQLSSERYACLNYITGI